jgi:hypothetical protein
MIWKLTIRLTQTQMLDVRRFRGGLTIYGELYFFLKNLKNLKKIRHGGYGYRVLVCGLLPEYGGELLYQQAFLCSWRTEIPQSCSTSSAQHSTAHIDSLYAMIPDTLRLIRIDSSQTCALVLTESRETLLP